MTREHCEDPKAKYEIVAWIEARGARKGCLVELKGEEGIWTVQTVDPIGLEAKELNEKQQRDRRSLTSITG